MRAAHLTIKLTLYYTIITGLVLIGAKLIPDFKSYLPIGGAEALLSGASSDPFDAIEIGAAGVENFSGSLLWLISALIGAVLTVFPTTWTYMAIRVKDQYDQSIVGTMMLLPIAVTAIVIIVNQSIALAFGLAGIVGGVRFRNTLKSSGDSIYIMTAISIGLAAGIGALEIAIIMTMVFNYCIIFLWIARYGEREGAQRYMNSDAEKPNPRRVRKIEKHIESPPNDTATKKAAGKNKERQT